MKLTRPGETVTVEYDAISAVVYDHVLNPKSIVGLKKKTDLYDRENLRLDTPFQCARLQGPNLQWMKNQLLKGKQPMKKITDRGMI